MTVDIERAVEVVNAYRISADKKFADIIKRGRCGEKNLELAAATAAGMEHAARNIAKRITALSGGKNDGNFGTAARRSTR